MKHEREHEEKREHESKMSKSGKAGNFGKSGGGKGGFSNKLVSSPVAPVAKGGKVKGY